jgi:hypothetical protein
MKNTVDSTAHEGARRRPPLLLAGVAAAALVLSMASQGAAAQVSQSVAPLPAATVRVNFHEREGDLLHTERLNNFADPEALPNQRAADVEFLNAQGLHSSIQRIWMDDDPDEGTAHSQLCNVATKKCDFSSVAGYLRDASNLADSILMVPMARTYIVQHRAPEESKAMLKLIIEGLKERYPKIEYIEAFNEPDWQFYGSQVSKGQSPILQPDELYSYYVPVYEAVNEINRELRPKVPLKVGGPAFASINEKWMKAFLDGYAADSNPMKRLDFISYHGYGEFSDDFRSFHLFKQNPSDVATQRSRINDLLADHHISQKTPVFVTESGIYPGPSFDDPTGTGDYLRQAAGVASLHYWYSQQPNTYPFNWVVRHANPSELRKDQLARSQDGQPTPAETFTPYGNMMLMQSKMKDTKVSATSDSLTAGQGVYAVASKDRTGASVMVWNYQHTNTQSFRTTIDMTNLPAALSHGPVRLCAYLIDDTRSNYFTNPSKADLQLVDERIVRPADNYRQSLDLTPNAVYLILLEEA